MTVDFAKYFPDGLLIARPIPLDACRILRPYLLERAGIAADAQKSGSVIMIAVPYAVPCKNRTVSMYAVAKDYHAYFAALFDAVLPALRADFPGHAFAGFADHSPIAEVDAACRAGLGVLGTNGLVLTREHSSYVFLGEVVTTLPTDRAPQQIEHCPDCGACRRACPTDLGKQGCLSDLTQKKGALSDEQVRILRAHPLVWGCDACQEACPYTLAAERAGTLYTTVPYFLEDLLPCPDKAALDAMSQEQFSTRAYAWRGRDTIKRNVLLKEEDA